MKRFLSLFLLIALLFAVAPAFAEGLPQGFDSHLQAYREYVRTLWFLTEKADTFADQQDPAYFEIYTQGHFFKDRAAGEFATLKKLVKAEPEACMEHLRQIIATDADGREFAVLKKIFGYNLRILKAKNPALDINSYLPKRAAGVQHADSQNLFFSREESHDPAVSAPASPSKWAMEEFERHFGPAPAPAFESYGTAAPAPQEADQIKTGWISGQYAKREGNVAVVTASSMNVRAGPSTDDAVVGKVISGQKLTILGEKDGWFQVQIPVAMPAAGGGTYRKISIVKGNIPFLVQSDSFLGPKEVILTFDDGPSAQNDRTATVIKVLQAAKAPGIFFCLGNSLKQAFAAPLIKTMKAAGSFPAVHGMYHATSDGKPFTAIPWATVCQHLTQTKELIQGMTGAPPVFFRPPYGIIRLADLQQIESRLNLIPVGWTIDSLDWSTKSPDELYTKITGMLAKRGKGILLMHDIHPQSVAVVPRLLAWLAQNKFTVVGPERLMDAFRLSMN